MRSLKRTFTRGNGGKLAFVWVLGAGVLTHPGGEPAACRRLLGGVRDPRRAHHPRRAQGRRCPPRPHRTGHRRTLRHARHQRPGAQGRAEPHAPHAHGDGRAHLALRAARPDRHAARERVRRRHRAREPPARIGPAGGGPRPHRRLRAAQRAGARRVDAMGTGPRAVGARPAAARATGPGRDAGDRRPASQPEPQSRPRGIESSTGDGHDHRRSAGNDAPAGISRSNAIPWTSPVPSTRPRNRTKPSRGCRTSWTPGAAPQHD